MAPRKCRHDGPERVLAKRGQPAPKVAKKVNQEAASKSTTSRVQTRAMKKKQEAESDKQKKVKKNTQAGQHSAASAGGKREKGRKLKGTGDIATNNTPSTGGAEGRTGSSTSKSGKTEVETSYKTDEDVITDNGSVLDAEEEPRDLRDPEQERSRARYHDSSTQATLPLLAEATSLATDSVRLENTALEQRKRIASTTQSLRSLQNFLWDRIGRPADLRTSFERPETEQFAEFIVHLSKVKPKAEAQSSVIRAWKELKMTLDEQRPKLLETEEQLQKSLIATRDLVLTISDPPSIELGFSENNRVSATMLTDESQEVLRKLKNEELADLWAAANEHDSPAHSDTTLVLALERGNRAKKALREAETELEEFFHPRQYPEHVRRYEQLRAVDPDCIPLEVMLWHVGAQHAQVVRAAEVEYSQAATEARRLHIVNSEDLSSRFDSRSGSQISELHGTGGPGMPMRPERITVWRQAVCGSVEVDDFAWSEPLSKSTDLSASTDIPPGESPRAMPRGCRLERHTQKWNQLREKRWAQMLNSWEADSPEIQRPPTMAKRDKLCVGKKSKVQKSGGARSPAKGLSLRERLMRCGLM